jgi:hypothetical protein
LAGGGVVKDGGGAGGGVGDESSLATGAGGQRNGGGGCCASVADGSCLRQRWCLTLGTVAAEADKGRQQVIIISCGPEECLMLILLIKGF